MKEIATIQTETGARQVEAGVKPAKTDATVEESGAMGENPLISNQRLRQIYSAMTQARALEKALPAAKRARATGLGAKATGILGLEACLVSAVVDLGPGDLVSDTLAGGAVEYLRGTALNEILRPWKAARPGRRGVEVRDVDLVCAAAGRLPDATGSVERMWTALGAAAALKAAAQAKVKDRAEDGTPRQAGVVVVYALAGGLSATLWKKWLKFSVEQQLPVIFVVLPAARIRNSKTRRTRTGRVSALALGCGIPAIVVDADDAVAIYRVAQESIGHARIGGGAALIECVPFVMKGAAGKVRVTEDAIMGLERTLVQRGIETRAWMECEAKAFAKRLKR